MLTKNAALNSWLGIHEWLTRGRVGQADIRLTHLFTLLTNVRTLFRTKVDTFLLVTYYTGMDKTTLGTSSGSLFVRDCLTQSGCPRHVGRNYVPLFGVAQSNVDLCYYV